MACELVHIGEESLYIPLNLDEFPFLRHIFQKTKCKTSHFEHWGPYWLLVRMPLTELLASEDIENSKNVAVFNFITTIWDWYFVDNISCNN